MTDEAAAYGFTVGLRDNSTHMTEYCTVIGHALYRTDLNHAKMVRLNYRLVHESMQYPLQF